MAHRFFVAPESIRDNRVAFNAAQAHQLRAVLRMKPGARIVVLDNRETEYDVVLDQVSPAGVGGEIVARRAAQGEPRTQVVLYQGLLKADKFEWVLQKGTEIGISEFVPVVTERSIARQVGRQKFARWHQIVAEAAEQAGRGKIPTLQPLQSFEQALLSAQKRGGTFLMPFEGAREHDLHAALQDWSGNLAQLLVGPEGGFTGRQVRAAEARGAQAITLGPRILRAETAGLVAASVILYARGDLSRV